MIELLPWDSAFLGFPVGRLVARNLDAAHLAALVAENQAVGTRLIYLVTDPADSETADAAHQMGAWLADKKVTFARSTTGIPVRPIFNHIERATAFTPQLKRLAWQSETFSVSSVIRNLPPMCSAICTATGFGFR